MSNSSLLCDVFFRKAPLLFVLETNYLMSYLENGLFPDIVMKQLGSYVASSFATMPCGE